MQEIEERISGTEDTIENIDKAVKGNVKYRKILTQNIQKIYNKTRKPNIRIVDIEESKDSKVKHPVNILNKITEENFPSLKKKMPMIKQEA
jgi:predicted transcriptional regulator